MVDDVRYQPDRGDFIKLNFNPIMGREQAGYRPALVLSPRNFNIGTGLCVVCPITHTKTGSSFEVDIPRGARVDGVVLTTQFRTIDWIERQVTFTSKANEDLVWEVLGRIEAILALNGPSGNA